jgi:NADPH:quinone reductase-like Zn-dependent oxidoreductase
MPWQHIRIARFGGPEVLELAEEQTVPAPGPGEVRIKVLAGGTGFTNTFIRRGRYPDFKGPLRSRQAMTLSASSRRPGPA